MEMKKAFTMLELVFVIMIVGILSYVVSSSFQRNTLREAADQVVSHIRYTQHLAMIDDKFKDNNTTWYVEKWQIRFRKNGNDIYYAIYSDLNQNRNVNCNAAICLEPAIDPLNQNPLFYLASSPNNKMNLFKKYGISDVISTCDVADSSLYTQSLGVISFDNLGRPFNGLGSPTDNTNSEFRFLLQNDCNITLVNPDGNVTITVTKETGYTYISSQNY